MENPFEAPRSDFEPDDIDTAGDVRVDGKSLVVRSPAILPLYCVKTNVPIRLQEINKRTLTWCSPYWILTFLLGGLLFVIIYLIVRKTCVISYGISPEVRRRFRNRLLIKSAIAFISFIGIVIAASFDSPVFIIVAVLLFGAALVSTVIGNSPLSITKHQKGEFWLSGCSPEFLQRIQEREDDDLEIIA